MTKNISSHFFLIRNWKVSSKFIEGAELSRDLRNHLKSLRIKSGSRIQISNGLGILFNYQIEKPDFSMQLLSDDEIPPASPLITLFLSPPRGDALWDSVSAATQLGCSEIALVASDNCELSKKPPRSDLWERLERVADASSEASRRAWALNFPGKNWFDLGSLKKTSNTFDYFFVCNESLARKKWGCALNEPVKKQTGPLKIGILIGPEGGWSPQELSLFNENPGLKPLYLGPQVLKVPVAVGAALTLCQAEFSVL